MNLLTSLPREVQSVFPGHIAQAFSAVNIEDTVEELRFRSGQNIQVISYQKEYFLPITTTPEDIDSILNIASNYSFYAQSEKIKKGYITIEGGHRMGFSGSAVQDGDKVLTIRSISSLNIRIARQITGAADFILPFLVQENQLLSTLILSPPRVGKTTMLRDVARQLSDGFPGFPGRKVAIVDERGEIAASVGGINQLNVGRRTDVLDNCNKPEGIVMLVRSMSPDAIITDEVGSERDVAALETAKLSGVSIIASAHGSSIEDITARRSFSHMVEKRIFDHYLFLTMGNHKREIAGIYDRDLSPLSLCHA